MNKAGKINSGLPYKVEALIKKGVRMTAPFSVEIDDEVDPNRIDASTVIYGAARICGANTLLSENVKLGYEAPVTLINCQLGESVELRGGYFADSVFLKEASVGSNAQVRAGCILEEKASANHTVGLKQTILFPFVTLGSLINFCDCLMAGGTSRKNHCEVGSSYIHFNYTPRQDKATPSLIGDVPRGVMLCEQPIFLGGQGGLVGPAQITYGTVIPAGVICRRDCTEEGMLWSANEPPLQPGKFPATCADITRKVNHNIVYVANILALRQWYKDVRRDFFMSHKYGSELYSGAINVLDGAVAERLKQLRAFAETIKISGLTGSKKKKDDGAVKNYISPESFLKYWPDMESYLLGEPEKNISGMQKDNFIKAMQSQADKRLSYIDAIQTLNPAQAKEGSCWLNNIVEEITAACLKINQAVNQGK